MLGGVDPEHGGRFAEAHRPRGGDRAAHRRDRR
jgi:hypothetical protein